MALLEIKNLELEFGRGSGALRVLDKVSLSLDAGETLCLVGETGSGKSVTALSVGRLLASPPAHYCGGAILLEGRDVLQMRADKVRSIRGRVVSYVFQEPSASLNPVFRVGQQIKESLKLHRPEFATDAEVVRLLKLVGIPAPERLIRNYPHELSGGMQQRVMIAMALAPQPKLLVADEPTTALDVTIQAQVIELLGELKRQFGMAILLITHNLGLVGDLADHVAVMYAGQIVESGPAAQILQNPLHPYTRALIDSVPTLGARAGRLKTVPGSVPQPGTFPSGCRFHPRCAIAQLACSHGSVGLLELAPRHQVRCPYVNQAVGTVEG